MLRVPGSINSKHNNNDKNKVTIISKWNGKRLSITPLLGDFHAYLIDQSQKKYYHKTYGNLLSRL
jgi:hypothetical protein